jgi:hypothetical protein
MNAVGHTIYFIIGEFRRKLDSLSAQTALCGIRMENNS